jgi:hypothetical protein
MTISESRNWFSQPIENNREEADLRAKDTIRRNAKNDSGTPLPHIDAA